MTTSNRVRITDHGRHLLAQRVDDLELRVHAARLLVEGADRGSDSVAEYNRVRYELEELRLFLDRAGRVDEIPDDPCVVQLGDEVELRLHDGTVEHYLIVHPVEAAIDMQRISMESPLSRALLGREVGEAVRIDAPAGVYSCTIMSAHR
jgi:transcription elongation GreA/GreB family factor